jgi:hypothetical protein
VQSRNAERLPRKTSYRVAYAAADQLKVVLLAATATFWVSAGVGLAAYTHPSTASH